MNINNVKERSSRNDIEMSALIFYERNTSWLLDADTRSVILLAVLHDDDTTIAEVLAVLSHSSICNGVDGA